MKYLVIIALIAAAGWIGYRYFGAAQKKPEGARSVASLHDLAYTSIDGREVSLSAYKGKAILFVNVASECGFTPQYEDLEKLHRGMEDRLVIVGFPSNDFGGQEPGTNEQIASFCKLNYGVSFPLSQKVSVVGKEKHPVYRWLTERSLNGWNSAEPKWNFHKYLVSEDGELLAVFPPTTKPGSEEVVKHLR